MDSPVRQARRTETRLLALLGVAGLAPLLMVIAVAGVKTGLLDTATGFDLLTMRLGRVLAFAGLAAALVAVPVAFRARRGHVFAGLAVVISMATVAGLMVQERRFRIESPDDVTTDPSEPPAFSRLVLAQRAAAGALPLRAQPCPGLEPVPTQVAPETASAALQSAGFTVFGSGAFRADGVHEGFWFGFTHDAAIRIRPGRTDVRVAARDARPGGDQACRLALRITEALQASR